MRRGRQRRNSHRGHQRSVSASVALDRLPSAIVS
jgi:hypothetical protein